MEPLPNPDYFTLLTDKLFRHLLSYLKPSELSKFSEVNRIINGLAHDIFLWKAFKTQHLSSQEETFFLAKSVFNHRLSKMLAILHKSLKTDFPLNKNQYEKINHEIRAFLKHETRHLVIQETHAINLEQLLLKFSLESQVAFPENYKVIYVPLADIEQPFTSLFADSLNFYSDANLIYVNRRSLPDKKILWIIYGYEKILVTKGSENIPFLLTNHAAPLKNHKFLTIYNKDNVSIEERIFEIPCDNVKTPPPVICSMEELFTKKIATPKPVDEDCPFSASEFTLIHTYYMFSPTEQNDFLEKNPEVRELVERYQRIKEEFN